MKNIGAVKKQTNNRHLNLYHIDALDRNGDSFDYYFASRNPEERLKLYTKSLDPEGIVIYALTKEASPRLVLIQEYRYPLDAEVYALPAGLVDPGETPGQAACFRRPFYMGPGFTDETSCAVFGTVEISDGAAVCEATEVIRTVLADREEVRRILSEERVSLRGAYLMMQYLHMNEEEPFAFLE